MATHQNQKVNAIVFLWWLDTEAPPRHRGRLRRPSLTTTAER
jgi:hypothetical protein